LPQIAQITQIIVFNRKGFQEIETLCIFICVLCAICGQL